MVGSRKKVSQEKPLRGKIALVAGATRGAGRGIAIALGKAGATVYCTGRSSRKRGAKRGAKPTPTPGRPETIKRLRNWLPLRAGMASPFAWITLFPRK